MSIVHEDERIRRVDDHAHVGIGRVDDEGWVVDFAGVRIGAVVDTRAPRHAAAA